MCGCSGGTRRRAGRGLVTSGDLDATPVNLTEPLAVEVAGAVPVEARYKLVARPDEPVYFASYEAAVTWQQHSGGGLLRKA